MPHQNNLLQQFQQAVYKNRKGILGLEMPHVPFPVVVGAQVVQGFLMNPFVWWYASPAEAAWVTARNTALQYAGSIALSWGCKKLANRLTGLDFDRLMNRDSDSDSDLDEIRQRIFNNSQESQLNKKMQGRLATQIEAIHKAAEQPFLRKHAEWLKHINEQVQRFPKQQGPASHIEPFLYRFMTNQTVKRGGHKALSQRLLSVLEPVYSNDRFLKLVNDFLVADPGCVNQTEQLFSRLAGAMPLLQILASPPHLFDAYRVKHTLPELAVHLDLRSQVDSALHDLRAKAKDPYLLRELEVEFFNLIWAKVSQRLEELKHPSFAGAPKPNDVAYNQIVSDHVTDELIQNFCSRAIGLRQDGQQVVEIVFRDPQFSSLLTHNLQKNSDYSAEYVQLERLEQSFQTQLMHQDPSMTRPDLVDQAMAMRGFKENQTRRLTQVLVCGNIDQEALRAIDWAALQAQLRGYDHFKHAAPERIEKACKAVKMHYEKPLLAVPHYSVIDSQSKVHRQLEVRPRTEINNGEKAQSPNESERIQTPLPTR